MQGLADGYFIVPHTITDYLSHESPTSLNKTNQDFFKNVAHKTTQEIEKIMNIKGSLVVDEIHRELGKTVWDKIGMSRNSEGLQEALENIPKIKEKFWTKLLVPGSKEDFNQELEKALRLKDFIELAELMALDALDRKESCGGHFREEFQTKENEAKRNDSEFMYVAAWQYNKDGKPKLFKEKLEYKNVKLKTRSYK
jgi:succinate dehydrogenase / fumarate reductase flavoprotein subunit